jgi:hypothetical protein
MSDRIATDLRAVARAKIRRARTALTFVVSLLPEVTFAVFALAVVASAASILLPEWSWSVWVALTITIGTPGTIFLIVRSADKKYAEIRRLGYAAMVTTCGAIALACWAAAATIVTPDWGMLPSATGSPPLSPESQISLANAWGAQELGSADAEAAVLFGIGAAVAGICALKAQVERLAKRDEAKPSSRPPSHLRLDC